MVVVQAFYSVSWLCYIEFWVHVSLLNFVYCACWLNPLLEDWLALRLARLKCLLFCVVQILLSSFEVFCLFSLFQGRFYVSF